VGPDQTITVGPVDMIIPKGVRRYSVSEGTRMQAWKYLFRMRVKASRPDHEVSPLDSVERGPYPPSTASIPSAT
jgi:hypothetical protein